MSNYRLNEQGYLHPYKAGAALTAHRFVSYGATEGEADACSGAGAEDVIGVNIKTTASGDTADVATFGAVTLLEVNGNSVNIAAGDGLKTAGASGIGVKAATDLDHVHAIALEAATADNVLIPVRIVRYVFGV